MIWIHIKLRFCNKISIQFYKNVASFVVGGRNPQGRKL
jgi:hypothetical protein